MYHVHATLSNVLFKLWLTGAVPVFGGFFGEGSGPIFIDDTVCSGRESSLLSCSSSEIGHHDCDHREDAGVRCEGIV